MDVFVIAAGIIILWGVKWDSTKEIWDYLHYRFICDKFVSVVCLPENKIEMLEYDWTHKGKGDMQGGREESINYYTGI